MIDRADRGLTRREVLRVLAVASGAVTVPASVGALAAQAGPDQPRPATLLSATAARAWFDLALPLIQHTPGYSPPVASRALAYLGVALYEAIVDGMPGFRSLQNRLPGLVGVPRPPSRAMDWEVVANAALARMTRHLFPSADEAHQRLVDELEHALTRDGGSRRTTASRVHGQQVADAIFAWSTTDGGHRGEQNNHPTSYLPPTGPGLWVPTPPAYTRAMQPTWGTNRPFAIPSTAWCAPQPPTQFSTQPGSAFHTEATDVLLAVNTRTPEQDEIARFWSDDPGDSPTPPGHAISILTQVLDQRQASLAIAAEAYLTVAVALADAFIACWATKYQHNLIRPITYIRQHLEPTWTPVLTTPPFPEYTSGHSVQSGAAFHVMAALFGDRTAFTDHTHDERGLPPRSFASFSQCAEEAALSRLYGGIHYWPAIDNGLTQGQRVGTAALALPTRARPQTHTR